jgi:acyl-coenzyme A synthetase/AMP-(fatty) acid ligase
MNNFVLNFNSETDSFILDFISKIDNQENIEFTTSGTTGEPKTISHTPNFITKNIKVNPKFSNVIWGLTYPSNKIAGSQVILQAYLNKGYIVNLFGKPLKEIPELISKYNITHLSATPTFYRLLLNGNTIFDKVQQVTFGGETVDSNIIEKVSKYFPNAQIKNIYASTEHGTLFASNKDYFEYSGKLGTLVQIQNNEILIYQDNQWVSTGDLIEWVDKTKFRIIGRKTNMINVGGYNVNPIKVENQLNNLNYISNSYVYKTSNSVLGNIVVADIVVNQKVDKSTIKNDLKPTLLLYEIPMKFNIVDSLQITDTGKISRK